TVKGYGLGSNFEGRNATHQMKKLTVEDLKNFRDKQGIPISDAEIEENPYLPPYYNPGPESEEIKYLLERRSELGGFLPERRHAFTPLEVPSIDSLAKMRRGSGKQEVATTMAAVRIIKDLMRDPELGKRLVPIIPDEARTFGMDSWFSTLKIYNPHGQNYTSVDHDLMLSYKEAEDGQILHEGINEAGSVSEFTAVGTSYSTHGEPMIPLYIFYSMFGFQRTGDFIWAAADQLARGFFLGATAGRTTLTGEGLQHMDGHSHLLAASNPAIVAYDPAFGFELAHIFRAGIDRMYGPGAETEPELSLEPVPHDQDRNVSYYITLYNEPVVQPAEPENIDAEALLKGLYLFRPAENEGLAADILASGVGMYSAMEAQEILAADYGVAANLWSATSWNELAKDGLECERHALRHPDDEQRTPFVTRQLEGGSGPVIAVSDYQRAVQEQIRGFVPREYITLGTDGFGFSDTRPAARRFFNTDAHSIVAAVLRGLYKQGEIEHDRLVQATKDLQIEDVEAAPEQTSDPGVA
uniref:transketolase-like TK C-terminal-containing protein n=1 Tax=Dietzia sp. TaxID=1871616 RepID=UPI003FA5801B